jgi:hypothetical protein
MILMESSQKTKWKARSRSIPHKDLLHDNTEKTLRREVRESGKVKEASGEELTHFKYFVQNTGMNFKFGTFGQIFSIPGTSEQPMWYTSNLKHVLELAKSEKRGVDPIFGVCIIGNRIFATNGRHYIGFPPHLKELNPEGKVTVDQVKELHQLLTKKPFPEGEINLGKLTDYTLIEPSDLRLEPSLGKVVKFLKYFEIASNLGLDLNLIIPEREYTKEMQRECADLSPLPFNLESILSDARFVSQKFIHSAQRIRDCFCPSTNLNVINTAEPSQSSRLEAITQDRDFRKAVSTFGDYSYGVLNWGEEIGREMDLNYTAVFIGKNGELLTQKKSPSRVIFIHVRDFASFALQAVQAYQILAEKNGVDWKDRLAIVGVSGASSLRSLNDEEKVKYVSPGYRIPDDDYGGRAPHSLFLGEDTTETLRKINEETRPTSKLSDPIYAYVRAMSFLAYPNDSEASGWLNSYPSTNRKIRHPKGQEITYNLMTRLKTDLKL